MKPSKLRPPTSLVAVARTLCTNDVSGAMAAVELTMPTSSLEVAGELRFAALALAGNHDIDDGTALLADRNAGAIAERSMASPDAYAVDATGGAQ